MIDKEKLMELVSNIARTNNVRTFFYGIVGELDMQAQRIVKLEHQVQDLLKHKVGSGPKTVTKKKVTKKTTKGSEE